MLIGTVVYLRGTMRRGRITSEANDGFEYTNVAVEWDDGQKQLVTVRSLITEAAVMKERAEKENQERLNQMHIKADECVVGSVVFHIGTIAPLKKGKIVGPLSNGTVIVEWEGGGLGRYTIKTLMNEILGATESQRILNEKDRLEKEFAAVESAVAVKLKEAAKLIREAGSIASKAGKDIQDMYEATSDLERAMDSAGWNTSSWHC